MRRKLGEKLLTLMLVIVISAAVGAILDRRWTKSAGQAHARERVADAAWAGDLSDVADAKEMRQKFAQRIGHFVCNRTALSAAIDMLQHAGKLHILVNWDELHDHAINPTDPITLDLQNAQASTVLEYILAQAAGSGARLVYCVQPDYARVSTAEGEQSVSRVYEIAEFSALLDKLNENQQEYRTRDDAVQALIKIIEETVEPHSWGQGDASAAITESDGLLLVTQTPQYQAGVADVLAQLRRMLHSDGALQHTTDLAVEQQAYAAPPQPDWTQPGPSPLDTRIADLRIDRASFTQAAAILAKTSGVNVVTDDRSAAVARLDAHCRITLHVKDVSLGTALTLLLGYGEPEHPLAWSLRGGVIWIGDPTMETKQQTLIARLYDVRDLVPNLEGQDGNELLETIRTALDGRSDADGQTDSGAAFRGRLLILDTRKNHRLIEQMLATMRREERHPTTMPTVLGPTTRDAQ